MKAFVWNITHNETITAKKWGQLTGKEVEIIDLYYQSPNLQDNETVIAFGPVSKDILFKLNAKINLIELPALNLLENRIENTVNRAKAIDILKNIKTNETIFSFLIDNEEIKISENGDLSPSEIEIVKTIKDTFNVKSIKVTRK